MNKVRGVVISITGCGLLQPLALLLIVDILITDNTHQLIVLHLLQHTVGTHIEVVAWTYVSDMHQFCLGTGFLMGLHRPHHDVLLRRSFHLPIANLAHLVELLH